MRNPRPILLALTVLLLATAAQAQTTVKASIPFAFVVGDHAYPAGEYTVKSLSQNGAALGIDSANDPETRFTISSACTTGQPATETKLVFQRMGDSYFLYQVWTAGYTLGRELPKSKTQVQITKNNSKPELVIVAAKISH